VKCPEMSTITTNNNNNNNNNTQDHIYSAIIYGKKAYARVHL